MSNRLSLGYSQAVAISDVERDWKDRLRLLGLFLGALALLAMCFGYIAQSLDSHKRGIDDSVMGWDITR